MQNANDVFDKNVSICSLDHMSLLPRGCPAVLNYSLGKGRAGSVLRGGAFIPLSFGSSVLLQNPKCVPKLEVKTT